VQLGLRCARRIWQIADTAIMKDNFRRLAQNTGVRRFSVNPTRTWPGLHVSLVEHLMGAAVIFTEN